MTDLPAGWRLFVDSLFNGVTSMERYHAALRAAFVIFCLVMPLDNLLEIPHGIYLWLAGEREPFAQWKHDYDPILLARQQGDRDSGGLRLSAVPPLTALPGLGLGARIAMVTAFVGTQFLFFPRRHVSLAVPVFGLWMGGLAGGLCLLFLEFAGWLRRLDESLRLFSTNNDWVARLIAHAGWQNRPWVYLVVLATGLVTGWLAARLLWREPERGRWKLLVILFTNASALSLAGLAVDIATRIRQPASFLSGTFVTLIISTSIAIWCLGPMLEAWKRIQVSETAQQ